MGGITSKNFVQKVVLIGAPLYYIYTTFLLKKQNLICIL